MVRLGMFSQKRHEAYPFIHFLASIFHDYNSQGHPRLQDKNSSFGVEVLRRDRISLGAGSGDGRNWKSLPVLFDQVFSQHPYSDHLML